MQLFLSVHSARSVQIPKLPFRKMYINNFKIRFRSAATADTCFIVEVGLGTSHEEKQNILQGQQLCITKFINNAFYPYRKRICVDMDSSYINI